ncbi:coproporphyrinogen-III oxidase family protein [Streptosporangium lutulentum]
MLKFESFTYPFFDLGYRVDHPALVSAFLGTGDLAIPGDHTPGNKALYLHIPFCDTICSFCPFVKAKGSLERIAAYLTALTVELRTLGATKRVAEWELDSVYIGGGTPSVLSEEQITALFAAIRANFRIKADAEISFEFEAKSVNEAKFQLLASLGVTRVSFGVQSFDPLTRDQVGITATLDQVHAAVDWSTRYFGNTNLDMMVGFPGQDLDAALLDARLAATSGIGSVSIYPVDYVMTLPGWQDRIRSGELPRPARLDERSQMFHAARGELAEHMAEQNMYCFGAAGAPPTRYMFSTLYGGYRDEAVGVGSGAYSVIRGLAYYNEGKESEYVRRASAGELPVVQSAPGHAYEKGLVFFPKRLTLDLRDLKVLSLEEVYRPRIEEIVDRDFATIDGDTLRLTEPGKLVYSELMAHFFSDLQRRLYLRIVDRMSTQVGMIDAEDWVGDSGQQRLGALNALPGAISPRRDLLKVTPVS